MNDLTCAKTCPHESTLLIFKEKAIMRERQLATLSKIVESLREDNSRLQKTNDEQL